MYHYDHDTQTSRSPHKTITRKRNKKRNDIKVPTLSLELHFSMQQKINLSLDELRERKERSRWQVYCTCDFPSASRALAPLFPILSRDVGQLV